MNIVYIATDSYVSLLGISVNSIVMNWKKGEKINLYICSPDLTEEHKEQLADQVADCNGTIQFIDVSDYAKRMDFQFNTSGFHPIVLARLFLDSYLPKNVERVLYLDCDVVVNGDIWGDGDYHLIINNFSEGRVYIGSLDEDFDLSRVIALDEYGNDLGKIFYVNGYLSLVPEASTYALVLGIFSLSWIVCRRRKSR